MADREQGLELTDFRGMYERGEISKEEYEKLRLKVASRVKPPETSSTVPNPPAADSPAAPPVAGPFPPEYFDDPPATPK